MIRTQISFDETLYRRAKRAAARMGLSLSELCRRSVAEMLAREDVGVDRPWLRYAGIIEGDPDDSVGVDRVVYGRESP